VTEPFVVTFLELADARDLRAAGPPRLQDVEIERVEPPDGPLLRWFYAEVGRHHHWTDLLHWADSDWQAWAAGAETWVAAVAGERAGYYVLDRRGESVEVRLFGLLPGFQGAGLGGHLLTHALRRALQLAPRVWLHTCTLDHPAALPNYQARGLRVFRTEARPG
jgi:GNAT superfamily N-acetyltransferase